MREERGGYASSATVRVGLVLIHCKFGIVFGSQNSPIFAPDRRTPFHAFSSMQCGCDCPRIHCRLTLSDFPSRISAEISGSVHERELGYILDVAFKTIVDGLGLVVSGMGFLPFFGFLRDSFPPSFAVARQPGRPGMSRLTSAYHINGPSAQQLVQRQALPAAAASSSNTVHPPCTDDLGFSANVSSNSHPFGRPDDIPFSGLPSLAALSETPNRMPTRPTTSVLGYNQSARDHPRQQASRWLILVIPPSFITQSQGAFGHTLSSGPSSRLSQGPLLPLYPTVNHLTLQLSEYSMSQLNPSDVCATGCDCARV